MNRILTVLRRLCLPLAGPLVLLAPAASLLAQAVEPVPPARPWALAAPAPEVRSAQLEQVASEADRLTRHGFELAGRRAYFAARAEFVAALRLVAQGLDTDRRMTAHSQALAAGLAALKEVDDFLPAGGRVEGQLDLPSIIAGHQTPVLKDSPSEGLTPLAAMKCYLSFAQEQLAAAAGREVAGSMALHALGKLHSALAAQKSIGVKAAEPKAMAFYQAAMIACPMNHLAANDLGVLLARGGHHADARRVLEHSLSLCPQPATWSNLAVVYERLGQAALSARAWQQSETLAETQLAARKAHNQPANPAVRWVDPEAFAATHARTSAWEQMPARTPAAGVPAPTSEPPERKSATGWRFPWDSTQKR